jgi:hypothetical protein
LALVGPMLVQLPLAAATKGASESMTGLDVPL